MRAIPAEGEWTIEMNGDADTAVVPELELAFRQAWAGTGTIVVDLEAVAFIDSRVMSLLEAWARQMREADRRMPVVCGKDDILRLFRIIGLDREFEFFADRASALAG